MKFYVVGFNSRYPGGDEVLVGDALVYAPSSRGALTRVRKEGLVPNPGDIYILGSPHIPEEVVVEDWMEDEARGRGLVHIWSEYVPARAYWPRG